MFIMGIPQVNGRRPVLVPWAGPVGVAASVALILSRCRGSRPGLSFPGWPQGETGGGPGAPGEVRQQRKFQKRPPNKQINC